MTGIGKAAGFTPSKPTFAPNLGGGSSGGGGITCEEASALIETEEALVARLKARFLPGKSGKRTFSLHDPLFAFTQILSKYTYDSSNKAKSEKKSLLWPIPSEVHDKALLGRIKCELAACSPLMQALDEEERRLHAFSAHVKARQRKDTAPSVPPVALHPKQLASPESVIQNAPLSLSLFSSKQLALLNHPSLQNWEQFKKMDPKPLRKRFKEECALLEDEKESLCSSLSILRNLKYFVWIAAALAFLATFTVVASSAFLPAAFIGASGVILLLMGGMFSKVLSLREKKCMEKLLQEACTLSCIAYAKEGEKAQFQEFERIFRMKEGDSVTRLLFLEKLSQEDDDKHSLMRAVLTYLRFESFCKRDKDLALLWKIFLNPVRIDNKDLYYFRKADREEILRKKTREEILEEGSKENMHCLSERHLERDG